MPSAVRPYIPWNLLNMPAGIVPITKVTERDDSELISLPNNDMVNSFSIFFLLHLHAHCGRILSVVAFRFLHVISRIFDGEVLVFKLIFFKKIVKSTLGYF